MNTSKGVRTSAPTTNSAGNKVKIYGDKIVDIQARINELEATHEKLFEEWKSLNEEKESITELLKIEARKLAVEGSTKVLVENQWLMVSVNSPARPVVFNYEKAEKVWKKDVIDILRPMVIDPKHVEAGLRLGKITEEQVQEVAEKGPLPTPRVTVKAA